MPEKQIQLAGWMLGGGRLFEVGHLITFSAFRMGAYLSKYGMQIVNRSASQPVGMYSQHYDKFCFHFIVGICSVFCFSFQAQFLSEKN